MEYESALDFNKVMDIFMQRKGEKKLAGLRKDTGYV